MDLITLNEFKAYEGIESDQHDRRISLLIKSASQLVKTYCSNSIIDFYSCPKEEYLTVDHETDEIFLTESPVRRVLRVSTRDRPNLQYTLLPSSQYAIDSLTDSIQIFTSSGARRHWPMGPNSVKVDYFAGYETTPEDLKLAVLDLVVYYRDNEHKPLQSVSNTTRQNPEESRRDPHFPPHIKRVLDLYKVY